MHKFSVFLLVFFTISCSYHSKNDFEKNMQRFVNTKEDILITNLGTPNTRHKMDNGDVILTFDNSLIGLTNYHNQGTNQHYSSIATGHCRKMFKINANTKLIDYWSYVNTNSGCYSTFFSEDITTLGNLDEYRLNR